MGDVHYSLGRKGVGLRDHPTTRQPTGSLRGMYKLCAFFLDFDKD